MLECLGFIVLVFLLFKVFGELFIVILQVVAWCCVMIIAIGLIALLWSALVDKKNNYYTIVPHKQPTLIRK